MHLRTPLRSLCWDNPRTSPDGARRPAMAGNAIARHADMSRNAGAPRLGRPCRRRHSVAGAPAHPLVALHTQP